MGNPKRRELLKHLKAQAKLDPDAPPILSLEQYFEGNTDEESIAPNQVDEGRPPLALMYELLRDIRSRPDVQHVLVGLHPDWIEAVEDDELWPAAENVHIYTTAPLEEVENWLIGLVADGAVEGWPYGIHPAAPIPRAQHKVFTVCWD